MTEEERYQKARQIVLGGMVMPDDYVPTVNVPVDGRSCVLTLRDKRAVDHVLGESQ